MFFPTEVVLGIMMSLHAYKYVLTSLLRKSKVMIPNTPTQTMGSGWGDFLIYLWEKSNKKAQDQNQLDKM